MRGSRSCRRRARTRISGRGGGGGGPAAGATHPPPEAGLDTPLSVTAFQAMDAVTLVGAATSAMMSRKFLERRAGIVHRSALTELTVTATMPFPWQVDGDFIDISNELVLSYEPDVLELVVP